jgi:putative flippase GtrA
MIDINKILRNKRLIRYFVMAVCIVITELFVFQIIYLLTKNYYVATITSFIIAVILNWIIGRMLVFGSSHHHAAKEFTMVLIASVIGLIIQLGVVFISVDILLLYPLIGKVLSILFSFFWNYWFRSAIIYKQ